MRPDFVLSRTPQIRNQNHNSEQNSSQWRLLNVSYLFRKANGETVSIPLLCLIQLNLVKWIKFEKQPPEVFCEKGVSKDFAKFSRKHLCQSLFLNKAAGLSPATLLRKRLERRYFPVNSAKYLRIPFSKNTSGACF